MIEKKEFIPKADANYPLPRDEYIHLFTAGVWIDVHQVLVRDHRFPEMKPNDQARLVAGLYHFLFEEDK